MSPMGSTKRLVGTLALACLLPSSVRTDAALPSDFNPAVVAQKALPSVVTIKVSTHEGNSIGSGFLIDASGTIITNLHVIRGATAAAVQLANGEIYDQVTVKAFDERKDLAIIQIAGFNLPVLPLGDSDKILAGQRVVVVGSALGVLQGSVSTGVVSGLRLLKDGFKVIQTDATANHGNSGGPMLNELGEVIGVVTFKLGEGTAENLNFAMPINYARGMLNSNSTIPLTQLASQLTSQTDLFAAETKPFPTDWKSLTSGSSFRVRIDGDHLYTERVFTQAQAEAGNFILSDLKKSGDRYVGVARGGSLCAYVHNDAQQTNRCRYEHPMVISLLTPTRIEGEAMNPPKDGKYDCRKCEYERPWQSTAFVWIPQ
jgi:hypothetical protein